MFISGFPTYFAFAHCTVLTQWNAQLPTARARPAVPLVYSGDDTYRGARTYKQLKAVESLFY